MPFGHYADFNRSRRQRQCQTGSWRSPANLLFQSCSRQTFHRDLVLRRTRMTLNNSCRHAASPITPLGRDPYSSSRRCVQPSGLSYRPEPARTGVHRQFCLSDTGSSPTPLAALKKLSGRADRRMRRVGEFIFQLEADAIDLWYLVSQNARSATQRPASPRWSRLQAHRLRLPAGVSLRKGGSVTSTP